MNPTLTILHKALEKGPSLLQNLPRDIISLLGYYLEPHIKMEMSLDSHDSNSCHKLHHENNLYPKCDLCKTKFADHYAAQNFYCKKCIKDFSADEDLCLSDDDYSDYFSMERKKLLCPEDEDCVEYGELSPAQCKLCVDPEDNRCQMCRFGELKLNKVFHWGFKENKCVIKECQVCSVCCESTKRELNEKLSIITKDKISFEYVEVTSEEECDDLQIILGETKIYSEDEFDDLEKLLAESGNQSNDPECKSDYSWEDI